MPPGPPPWLKHGGAGMKGQGLGAAAGQQAGSEGGQVSPGSSGQTGAGHGVPIHSIPRQGS